MKAILVTWCLMILIPACSGEQKVKDNGIENENPKELPVQEEKSDSITGQ